MHAMTPRQQATAIMLASMAAALMFISYFTGARDASMTYAQF